MRQARGVHISIVCLSDADTRVVRSNASAQVALCDTAGAERPLRARIGTQLIVLERQLDLTCEGFFNVQFAEVINPRGIECETSGALIAVSSNGRVASKRHRSASIHSVSTRVRIGIVVRTLGIGVGYLRIVERA